MSVSSSIQFRGIKSAMQAYEDRGVDAWSIWQGKTFMNKGVEGDTLRTFIEALDNSGSTAIYTIKVYEDVTDAKKIKSNTPDDGSFNFRLYERDAEPYQGGRSYSPGNGLQERFDRLEERLNGFLEAHEVEPEEPEEPKDLLGTITGLLQDPDKLEKLIALGRTLLGQPVQPMQPAYMGNVKKLEEPGTSTSLSPSINDAEANVIRLGKAIDTLERNDPQVIEHLEKLAKISVENPRQFHQLISMLDVI